MAITTAPVTAASKALNCQTWVLKVSIDCQGCKRKVRKCCEESMQSITVTGNIEVVALIKKLKKKQVDMLRFGMISFTREKKEGTRASNRNDQDVSKTVQKHDVYGNKDSVKFSGDGSNEEKENTDDSTTSKNEGSGEKKNKKAQKGNANTNHSSGSATSDQAANAGYGGSMNQTVSSTNLNPTRQLSVPHPQGFCYVPSARGQIPAWHTPTEALQQTSI